ncbi:MAG: hypothetical protein KIS80_05600 [Anaerolineales bacterium]|nr:hypothetical protein [Anaerolineales bacterium]
MKRHLTVAALVALLLLSACSAGARTSRDLPRDMPLGIWGDQELIIGFKDNQVVIVSAYSPFSDFPDFEQHGSYSLADEDTVLLSLYSLSDEIDVTLSDDKQQISIESRVFGSHRLQHIAADTSRSSLRARDIEGTWLSTHDWDTFLCLAGGGTSCGSSYSTFTLSEGGELGVSYQDGNETWNFELVEDDYNFVLGGDIVPLKTFYFGQVLILSESPEGEHFFLIRAPDSDRRSSPTRSSSVRTSDLVGSWRNVRDQGELIEFHRNGSVSLTDQGETYLGTYEMDKILVDIGYGWGVGTISGDYLSLVGFGGQEQFRKTVSGSNRDPIVGRWESSSGEVLELSPDGSLSGTYYGEYRMGGILIIFETGWAIGHIEGDVLKVQSFFGVGEEEYIKQ